MNGRITYPVNQTVRIMDDPYIAAAFLVYCGRCKKSVGNLTIEQARERRDSHDEACQLSK